MRKRSLQEKLAFESLCWVIGFWIWYALGVGTLQVATTQGQKNAVVIVFLIIAGVVVLFCLIRAVLRTNLFSRFTGW